MGPWGMGEELGALWWHNYSFLLFYLLSIYLLFLIYYSIVHIYYSYHILIHT